MKVFILLGHPNKEGTFGNALADAYEKGAKMGGHEVRRVNIGDLHFDPILHKGYKEIQQLEPDLKQVQEDIKWSDHVVLIYPLWWSSAPSLLKGMIDRMWLPAFAFRFKKLSDGKTAIGWEKLLKGRTARVVVTLKNFPFVERFMFGDYTAEIEHAVFGFSGLKTRLTEIGNAEAMSDKSRARWFSKMERLGKKAH